MSTIIEIENFISESERNELIDFVRKNNNKLLPISHYSNLSKPASSFPLYYYGAPVYPSSSYDEEYFKLNKRSEELKDLFLRAKVSNKLETLFSKKTKQLDKASYPGFHIFKKSKGKDNFFTTDNYHVDNDIFKYSHFLNYRKNKIYSFNVVIQTTLDGDSLDYMVNGESVSMQYNERSLYVWEGSILPHKIGDVYLIKNDDMRITYQGHFIETEDELLVYW